MSVRDEDIARSRQHPDDGHKIWRVELTAALAVGGNATAKRVDYDGNSYELSLTRLTVYDPLRLSGGKASGERLLAYYNTDSERWEVLAGASDGIPIKSNYSGTIPAYGLVYVDGYEASTGAFTVNQVGTTFKRQFLVNSGTAIVGSGTYGTAQKGPFVTVLYDSGTPALDESFGPQPSSFSAKKNYPDIFAVQGIASAIATTMRCRQKELDRIHFQLEADLAKNYASGGTGKIMHRNAGTWTQISNWTATVYNWYGDIDAGTGTTGQTYPADGIAVWIQGHWEIVAAECAPGVAP